MLCGVLKEKGVKIPIAFMAVLFAVCGLALGKYAMRENAERAEQHEIFLELTENTNKLLAHVPKEEHLEILGYRTEPKWYVAAKALPCMRFYFLQETLANADPKVMDEIVAEFESDPPKWLVIYYNREFGPPYDARVAEIFETKYEFIDSRGTYQLKKLKEAP